MRDEEPPSQGGIRPERALEPFGLAFMTPLVLCIILNPINSSMLATALTAIGHSFPEDPSAVAWLIASLYLAGAISQPLLGRCADLYGPRRTLVFGSVVVALGGALGAVAPTLGWLVVSRVLIGVGTSAAYPCAMAMIRYRSVTWNVQPSGRVLAVISAAGAATTTLGPSIGGLIVAGMGWRWVFLINLPVALLGLVLALRQLSKDPPPKSGSLLDLDLPGMALFSGGMLGLMLFFMHLKDGFNPWLLGSGVVLLAALGVVEWRRASPFIDLRMAAHNVGLRRLYIRNMIMWTVMYAYFFAVPQWMQSALKMSPGDVGLLLLPYGVISVACSFGVTRFGHARLARSMGGMAMLIGCVALFFLTENTPLGGLLLVTALFGAASGSTNIVNQQSLMHHAPAEQTGAAAGLLRTSQYCGAMLATPLTAMMLHDNGSDAALHALALTLVPMALLVVFLLLIEGRRARAVS